MTRSPLMFMTALLEKKAQLPATGRWFQTCFSTMGCPEKDLPAILELAGRHDIDCLELRSVADRIDLPEYFRGLPGGIDGLRDMLAARDASVRILGTSFKLVGDTETGRQSLLGFAALRHRVCHRHGMAGITGCGRGQHQREQVGRGQRRHGRSRWSRWRGRCGRCGQLWRWWRWWR
jgi:hypothetical protein